jgi:DNA-binding LacI/PurR family transcriptional regulator
MVSKSNTKPRRRDIVYQGILKIINDPKTQLGERLISERKLAERFDVNHLTVRSALTMLEQNNVVERRHGSGTYVISKPGDEKFITNSNNMVVVVMRNSSHLFGELNDRLLVCLQQQGYIPIAIGVEAGDFDIKPIIQNLKRLLKMNCKKMLIDQTLLTESLELAGFITEEANSFDNIVRVLGHSDSQLPGNQVTCNYLDGYRKAIQHLKKLGHYQIAFFGGKIDNSCKGCKNNRKWASLYTEIMIEENLAAGIKIVPMDLDFDIRTKDITDFFSTNKDVTAAICESDSKAIVAITIAQSLGIKMPEDFSLVGFYNTPWAKSHSLTTLDIQLDKIANCALKLLQNDYKNSSQVLSLDTKLLIQNSTRKNLKTKSFYKNGREI